MRILVLFAHPLETGFAAGVHKRVVETLRGRGHEVDDLDLYAEHFDPVLPRETLANYLDTAANRAPVGRYVERLLAAEGLVIVSPVWHDGFPAILKGFFDRVFLPGVSFKLDHGWRLPADAVEHQAARGGLRLWRRPKARVARRRSGTPFRHPQPG